MYKQIVWLLMLIACTAVSAQDTQGFFLNNRPVKKAVVPAWSAYTRKQIIHDKPVIITIDNGETATPVSPFLFGNNANPYMTQIVTQPKLMDQLKKLSPGIIRFPGGNLSNLYFWDAVAGRKPADVPDTILYGDRRPARKSRFWYGKNDDPMTLSLENYYRLLTETGSTGTICVNAGYARYGLSIDPIARAAHYAAEWVRYDKGRTRYWEIGNEDYGVWQAGYRIDTGKNKDGQPAITSGALYGRIFKAFADSMKQAAKEISATIYIGATIIEDAKEHPGDKEVDKYWNSGFFKTAGNSADFFVVHSYYTPWEQNSTADVILRSAAAVTGNMMNYVKKMVRQNNAVLKPVALTEWNIFAIRSKQQTSFINGMHAALVLGEMAKQQFGMACRWDLANGYANGDDHGLFNKGDEPGMPQWSARPAYFYMYYFRKYFGNRLTGSACTDTSVAVYASAFDDGRKGIVLVNKDKRAKNIILKTVTHTFEGRFYGYTLTGGNDNGEFSQRVIINDVAPSLPAGGPENIEAIKAWSASFKGEINITCPARAVQYILID